MPFIPRIPKTEEAQPGVSAPAVSGVTATPANPHPLAVSASLSGRSHCEEKGCVFPVAGPGIGKCLVHDREELEPEHFESFQPTVLLLDRARFGLPDAETEPDDSRAQDRHRQAAEREAFLEDVA